MLEVVGVALAVLDDGVGDHIVVVLLDVQSDALSGQNVLADLQDLAVGSGSSSAADGRAVQCIVVDGSVIAIGRGLDDGDDSALVVLIHEVLDLLALQSGDEGLDLGLVLVALLADQNIDVSRRAVLHCQSVGHGVQTSGDGVVGVDDSVVLILQDVGDLSSLDLIDGDVQGVLLDVVLGSGQAGVSLQLEEAVLLQQGQSAGLVGGVVGDSDLHLVQLCCSGSSLRRSGSAGSSRACGGRRAAAGGQGSSSGCDTGNFQKITTSNHSFFPLYYWINRMYSGGAAQSAPALNGSIKKASVPASHALHKDGGLKLPWYHLGSQHPRGHCLKTAAEFFLLTAGRFNGRTRRGLVLLLFVRAAPRPFSAPCFLPFSTCRALW